MKNKEISNKLLFSAFLTIIVFFILLSFQKYFLNMNYLILTQANCDPLKEQCFVGYCDPIYEECSGIKEEDAFYYKKVQKLANSVPLCDPENESCVAVTCDTDNLSCTQIFCDSSDDESECFSFINN